MRKKLTIIIPHYKEPLGMVDALFRSIDGQRMIDFSQIEVLVVNDCGEPLQSETLRYNNFVPRLISTTYNGGVGVARQCGFDNATGEYATIIDADDVLSSPHALFYILSAIHEKPGADLYHGRFVEEQIVEENYCLYGHDRDVTFCHAKVYRVAFLRDKNVRCHPTLRYCEDSYFNALVYAEAERIEYIDTPLVVWCYNPASTVRLGGLYGYRELPCYIQSVSDLCAELVARRKDCARVQFLQALYYIYFQLQDEAWESKRVRIYRPEVIRAASDYFHRHADLYECGETERLQLYSQCRTNYKIPIMERQTLADFIKEIKTFHVKQ